MKTRRLKPPKKRKRGPEKDWLSPPYLAVYVLALQAITPIIVEVIRRLL
jgi:hypothetical protein